VSRVINHVNRSRGGRPAEYPPVVFLALGVLAAQTGSIRSAVRALEDEQSFWPDD
jgi:hypothetical protein